MLTEENSFGFAGNYWDIRHLAGLDLAFLDEASSKGHKGNKASEFISDLKKDLAEDLGVTVTELDRMGREADARAAAAVEAKGSALSKAFQAKHAKRSGRGKKKGKRKTSRKVGSTKCCTHPGHDSSSPRTMSARGVDGEYHGKRVLMCSKCNASFGPTMRRQPEDLATHSRNRKN